MMDKYTSEVTSQAYLSRTCLWQIGDEVDLFRGSERANDFANLKNEFLDERTVVLFVVLEFPAMDTRDVSRSRTAKIIGREESEDANGLLMLVDH
jgi:hypothetical protein